VAFFRGGPRVTQLRFDRIDSSYPFVLDIPQSTTERLLGDQLKALGGEVERQVELVGIEREADGGTALLEHADGRRERQRARYLCGCDGAHSRVRELTGTSFAGTSYEEEWILADVRIGASPFARDEATIFAERTTFSPSSPSQTSVGACSRCARPVRLFDPAWITPFRIGRKHV